MKITGIDFFSNS